MNFDLRLPIGIMFSFYGVILVLYGLLGDKAQYNRSLGINVNLAWGLVLLVFGAAMLLLARRAKARPTTEPQQPAGESEPPKH